MRKKRKRDGVCVCVRERESEREKMREKETLILEASDSGVLAQSKHSRQKNHECHQIIVVCAPLCVCV